MRRFGDANRESKIHLGLIDAIVAWVDKVDSGVAIDSPDVAANFGNSVRELQAALLAELPK